MPGRPPKPTALHLIQGTARKARMAKRAGEVEPEVGLPEAPEWLCPEGLIEWGRVTSDSKYLKAIRRSDWESIAIYCQMWGMFVEGVKKGEPVAVSHIAAMINLGAKLGRSPADRVKVHVPETPKQATAWQQLKAGGE